MKFKFPLVPSAKIYKGNMTQEQEILMKLTCEQTISYEEESILKEVIDFNLYPITNNKTIDK